MRKIVLLLSLSVVIGLFSLVTSVSVVQATAPDVSASIPGESFIGEDFSFTVTFDNTSTTDVGYGPFIDLVFPVTGVDGDDGISFLNAIYLGAALDTALVTTQTFPLAPLGEAPCTPSQSRLEHPLVYDNTGTKYDVCGTPGDTLVTLELPFGSFSPDQPPAEITINARTSPLADLGVPLPIRYRSGFQFGADPLQNPCCDLVIINPNNDDSLTWPNDTVTPTLFTLEKTLSEGESEITTGPNDPSSWTITIDVANGQTISDLDVFDYLPTNAVILGVGGFSPAGGVTSLGGVAPAYPYGPSNANELIVNFPSVTGGPGTTDATFTIDFYIDYADADGNPVLNTGSGADNVAENRVELLGDWATPLDPRDVGGTDNVSANGPCPTCPPATTHQLEPLAIQKSASTGEVIPGDIVTYTLNVQVSDYFAVDNIVITDVISDGQRVVGVPQMSYEQHGSTVAGPIGGANYEVREYFTGGSPGVAGLPDPDSVTAAAAGDSVLYIDVSAEILADAGLNETLGGCVPAGGTGGPAPDCGVFNGGQTTITITYTTQVQDNFTDDFPSGDPSVDQGDALDNVVDIVADVLNVTNLVDTGNDTTDGSSAGVIVPRDAVVKSIYAISSPPNAPILSPPSPVEVMPEDTVTYRILYNLTTTDFENLEITDYPPLPVLDATTITTFNVGLAGTGTPPGIGEATFGPADTFFADTGRVPTISVDGVSNSVTFDFGDYDDPGANPTVLDLLLTFEVSSDPFADALFLTNQAEVSEGSTQGATSTVSSIVQIVLREPALFDIQKGVRTTTNPNATVTEDDSTLNMPFGSNDFEDDPIDSDVADVDGGDLVTFSIAVQNSGGAAAYDIVISDIVQPGFVLPADPTDLNLTAMRGDGTNIGLRFLGGNNNEFDLFRNATSAGAGADGLGVELIDPEEATPGAGGICQKAHPADGTNIIIITYTLQVDPTITPPASIENTARVEDYTNTEGGSTFIPDEDEKPTDSAMTEIAEPEITKAVIATSEADTTGSNLAIGEIVRYRIEAYLPEGGYTALQITDQLPNGLQFLNDNSATYAFIVDDAGDLTSTSQTVGGCTDSAQGFTPTCAFAGGTVTTVGGSGDDITFNFGDVSNVDDDGNFEYVVIEFNALVRNESGNQATTTLDNTSAFVEDGTTLATSDPVTVTLVEPVVSITKNINSGLSSTAPFDAGDTVVYDVVIENTGSASAYDVEILDTLAAELDFINSTTGVQVLDRNNNVLTAGTDYTDNSDYDTTPGNEQASVTIPVMTTGATDATSRITVRLTTVVLNAITPTQAISNAATLTYTSLPGPNGSTGNGTNSDTPGGSGTPTGERDGSGGVNDYSGSDDVEFTSAAPAITKQLEHPSSNPPAAPSAFAGGVYTDSTSDANTGTTEHNGGRVDITPGETYNYIITVTLAEGTTNAAFIRDLAEPRIAGAEVIDILGAEIIYIGANLSGTTLDTIRAGLPFATTITDGNSDGDGDEFEFDLGDVLNTPDNSVTDADRIVVRVNARMDDDAANEDGDQARNRGTISYTDSNNTTQNVNVTVDVDIVEPDITLDKSVTNVNNPNATITAGDAEGVEIGDTVTYTVTITNNGTSTAYEISGTDALPSTFIDFDALDTVTSTCDNATGWTFASTTDSFTYSFDALDAGTDCTIVFTGTVTSDVLTSETYTNTAAVTEYSSQPGTPTDERVYPSTDDTADVTISETVPVKEIAGTSETHTDESGNGTTQANAREVAVGEVITYRLTTSIPEAQVIALSMVDTLASGVAYVPGSARISYLATTNPNGITFADANLSGVQNEAVPTTVFPAANIGIAGNDITFSIGTVTNNDDDDNSEFIIIDFNVVVVNNNVTGDTSGNGVNDVGDLWSNTFEVFSENAVGTIVSRGTSPEIWVEVVEPDVAITKTINGTLSAAAPYEAGDTVVYDVAITNNGNADAFDLRVIDTLVAELDFINSTTGVQVLDGSETPLPGSAFTDNSTYTDPGEEADVTINRLNVGATVIVRLTTVVQNSVTAAQVITNQADLTYTGLPGTNGTGDVTPGNPGDSDGERNGSGTGPNDYNDTDSVDFTVGSIFTLTKDVSTATATIGETVTYTLTLTLIEGTVTNVTIVDTFPAGYQYVTGSMSVTPTNGTTGYTSGDESFAAPTLTIPLGTVVTTPDGDDTNNTVVITYDVVILNTSDNNDADTDTNSATASGDDVTDSTDGSTVTLTEPNVSITKTVNGTLSDTAPFDAGDTVVYDVVIENTGTSDAHDVQILDTLVAELDFAAVDGVVVLDRNNNVLTAGTDYTDNSDYDTTPGNEQASVTIPVMTTGATDATSRITVRLTTVVQDTVSEGQVLTNQADLTYTSLPGSPSEERDGSGGVDDYNDTDIVDITIGSTYSAVKSIVATSDAFTDDSSLPNSGGSNVPVAIGEVVRYRLVTQMAEGTMITLQLTDQMALDGTTPVIVPIFDENFEVSTLNQQAGTLDFVAFAGLNAADSGTVDLFDNTGTAQFTGLVDYNTTTNFLQLDFGNVVNGDTDANDEFLVLEFDAIIVNVAQVTLGDIYANDYQVFTEDSGTPGTPVERADSDDVSVVIVTPDAAITKTFVPDELVRGETGQMVLVVTNNGNGPLYNIDITDTFDGFIRYDGMTPDTTSATQIVNADVVTVTPAGTGGFGESLRYQVANDKPLLPGETLTLTIDFYVDDTAPVPVTITNTVDITGDSSPDSSPEQREDSDSGTDDLAVVIPQIQVTKTDSADPVTPGQTFNYVITVTHTGRSLTQAGTTGTTTPDATNVTVTDTLPTDFIVSNVLASQGSCSPIAGGVLTCTLGTLAANGGTGSSATITVTGRYAASVVDNTTGTNSAVVTTDEGNNGTGDTPDDGDDERADEETLVTRLTDLELTKTVNDPNPVEGDLITYTLTVRNLGGADTTNVVVTDSLPAEVTFSAFVPGTLPCVFADPVLTCTFPTIAASGSRTIGIEATVDAGAATAPQPIVNTATVTANEAETDTTNNEDSAEINISGADLELTKTVDDPTPAEGDTIVYSILLRNTGPGSATNITVTDALPAGVAFVSSNAATLLDSAGNPTSYDDSTGAWVIGSLNSGQQRVLQITATVGAGTSGTIITNTAEVTAVDQPDPDSTPGNNTGSEDDQDDAIIAVGGVDIALVKTVNENTPNAGGSVTYSLRITNNGPSDASGVSVTDDIAGLTGVTYASHLAPSGTSYNPGTGVWTVGDLANGDSLTLQITVDVLTGTSGDTIVNSATVTSTEPDSDPSNNTDDVTIIVNTVDLAVTKTVSDATPDEGDTIVYSVRVQNLGPGDASNVVITDLLPAGVTYVSDNSASINDSSGNPTAYDDSTGQWTIGLLTNTQARVLQITVTVDAGTSGTSITNTATRTSNEEGDDDNSNDSDDAQIAVSGLDLAVNKSVDNPTPNEGDTIVYSVTVTNNGPAQATNVSVTDELDTLPVTFVSSNAATLLDDTAAPTSYNDATGVWAVGTLDSGSSLTLEITVTVDNGSAGTSATNTATGTSDQADSNPGNNTDDAQIDVGGVDVQITKTVDNPTPNQGDTVTYTLTVTNNGPATATGITVNESLPLDNVNFSYVSDNPSQGTFTRNNPPPSVWDVGTLNSGASATLTLTARVEFASGQFTNTATITTVDQPDSDNTNDSDDAIVAIGGVDLAVTKTVDNANPATGDDIIYSVTVTNVGTTTATSVTVTDIPPAGLTYLSDNSGTLVDDSATATFYDSGTGDWTVGVLNAGSSLTLQLTMDVTASDGRLVNTATVDANETDANPDNDEDDAVIAINAADLRLDKTRTVSGEFLGDPIQYQIVVTNDGPNTAFNVSVRDDFPATVTFDSASATQGSYNDATGIWTIGTLNVGQSVTLTINATVTALGSQVNTAEIITVDQPDPDSIPDNGNPDEDDQDSSDSSVIFDPPFGIKSFDDEGLPELLWTMVWVNPGTAAVDATVVDPLQAGTTFIPGSLTCTSSGILDTIRCEYDAASDSVIWRGTVYPSPGATQDDISSATNPLIISFRVTIDDQVRVVNNVATFTDADTSAETDSSVTWERPGGQQIPLEISKVADPAFSAPGEEVTWSITVRNPTGIPLQAVRFYDRVPDLLEIVAINTPDGVSASRNGQTVNFQIDDLGIDEGVVVQIVTRLPSGLELPPIYENMVTLQSPYTGEASATVSLAAELPATGETPQSRADVLAALLVVIGAGAGALVWWLRR